MDKLEASKNAERARSIVAAMRAQGDHRTSLKSAVEAWEREAARFEVLAR
jgi:hypothetical protein